MNGHRGIGRIEALLAAGWLLAAGGASAAQPWKPTKPVAFINGSAAGGSIDLTARVIQRIWDDRRTVGQPIVVVNKPGSGNGLAWSYLNDRGGDGHSIAIGTTSLVSNPVTGAHPIGYRDVTPLAILFDDYAAFIVRADSPLRSMREVIERLRRDPGAVSIAYAPGVGSGTHSAAVAALRAGGISVPNARLVPFKSAPEALTSMIGGEIDVVSATPANLPSMLTAGRVRVIGITGPKRLYGQMADAPTLREQGIDCVFTNWRGVIGPKGMRPEHVAWWVGAVAEAVKSDTWQRELERYFWSANFLTGDAALRFIEEQALQFRTVWAEANRR